MTKIILVLGSPNSTDGTLSPMALSRAELCYRLYTEMPARIILTGGFGPHFNTSDKPHAHYLKLHLLSCGVPETDILSLIESANSVEDASLSKRIINKHPPVPIHIITSDYHLDRAKFIFETVYAPFKNFIFSGASSEKVPAPMLEPLIQHEKIALQGLMENGVWWKE